MPTKKLANNQKLIKLDQTLINRKDVQQHPVSELIDAMHPARYFLLANWAFRLENGAPWNKQ